MLNCDVLAPPIFVPMHDCFQTVLALGSGDLNLLSFKTSRPWIFLNRYGFAFSFLFFFLSYLLRSTTIISSITFLPPHFLLNVLNFLSSNHLKSLSRYLC